MVKLDFAHPHLEHHLVFVPEHIVGFISWVFVATMALALDAAA